MQDSPSKTELLQAVAKFLSEDLRGAVKDQALAFRVLIAANLVQIVATEIEAEEKHDAAELSRLFTLLRASGEPATTASDRRGQIRGLNEQLAAKIRAGSLDATPGGGAWQHVQETLREKLQVDNPRFDLKKEIES